MSAEGGLGGSKGLDDVSLALKLGELEQVGDTGGSAKQIQAMFEGEVAVTLFEAEDYGPAQGPQPVVKAEDTLEGRIARSKRMEAEFKQEQAAKKAAEEVARKKSRAAWHM